MDLDLHCVAAIVKEGRSALQHAVSKGIKPEWLQGEGSTLFAFILEYVKKYPDEWPNQEICIGRTGIVALDEPTQAAEVLVDMVLMRNLHERLRLGLDRAGALINKIQPYEAHQELETLLAGIRSDQAVTSNVESIFRLGPEVLDYYQRLKDGVTGILTPWNTINEMTLGFWPEDLVLFVARIAVGKTWMAILLALCAWKPKKDGKEGKRVLFITTEVSKTRVGMRLFAAHERLPYGEFTHGRLSFLAEDRLRTAVTDLLEADGFFIIGGDFDFKMSSVELAIENCRPDVVVIDGAYLLQAEGASRTERMASIFNDLKRLAKRRKVTIILTTQLNRGSKKGETSTVELDSIALSDVGGWNADLVFGLIRTEDNEKDRQMTIKPLKVREGAGAEFVVNWNFERMDFSEIVVAGTGNGDANETGASASDDGPVDEDLPF